jgi:hypothetical protein
MEVELLIMETGRQLSGNIKYEGIEEKLTGEIKSDGQIVLKGTSRYNFNGTVADDGSIKGDYEQFGGIISKSTGKWSVSKTSEEPKGTLQKKIPTLPAKPCQPTNQIPISSPDATSEKITIASLTKNIPDTDYFVEQSKNINAPFDVVWAAANKYFAKYKFTIANSDPAKGVLVSAPLVKPTSYLQLPLQIDFHSAKGSQTTTPSIRFGGTQNQIFILVERVSENSTKVTTKSFCYKEYANGWQKLSPCLYSEKTLENIEQEVKRQRKNKRD